MPNSSEFPLGDNSPLSVPQFATAEYTGTERCAMCGNLLAGEYYRVANKMVCGSCGQRIQSGQPVDSHRAFARGLTFGIGAAVVGMAAYATFTIVTGWYLGYIALAVGWFVAKAIEKGSGGLGGQRYQIAAVLLTYLAISTAAIPIGISYAMKHSSVKTQQSAAGTSGNGASADSSVSNSAPKAQRKVNAGALLGQLLLWGIASPFLELSDPFHGLIGLVILFVGLRIAWRMTAAKQVAIDGPFTVTAA